MPARSRTTIADHPVLAGEWDAEANGDLGPATVSLSSSRQLAWRCERGHRWSASPVNRRRGDPCPYCAGHRATPETSLAALHPRLAADWDPGANAGLSPEEVLPHTTRAVWWRCAAGHRWRARVDLRVERGAGCPACAALRRSGRPRPRYPPISVTRPALAAEWHPSLNRELTPEMVSHGNHRKVWWRCAHGHEWQAAVNNRAVHSTGCPYCAGTRPSPERTLATTHPRLAAEWDRAANGALGPESVSAGSVRRVWWVCPDDAEHRWRTTVANRVLGGSGCPRCAARRGRSADGTTRP